MLSGIRPQKRLGQHFLRDRSIAERIIQSMSIGCEDRVLEIGAGEGVLTERLIESPARRIVAVELDSRLAGWLKGRFEQNERFEIIEADFLKLDLGPLFSGDWKIRAVGNIPYSITTPILFRLLDDREKVRDVTVTLQKEVGERIISPPGCKAYGIPSVLFQSSGGVDDLSSSAQAHHGPVDLFCGPCPKIPQGDYGLAIVGEDVPYGRSSPITAVDNSVLPPCCCKKEFCFLQILPPGLQSCGRSSVPGGFAADLCDNLLSLCFLQP